MSADRVVEVIADQKPMMEVDEAQRDAEVFVELLHDPKHEQRHFRVSRNAVLLDVLDEGAKNLGVTLLPDPDAPLDQLRPVFDGHQVGEPLDLDLMLEDFLRQKPPTHLFAVELVLAIQINTRWRIAPEKQMTPKDILALAGLPWQEYSLYFPPDSVDPLPPDTPVELHRGQRFEAQRDGKYGQEGGSADRNR